MQSTIKKCVKIKEINSPSDIYRMKLPGTCSLSKENELLGTCSLSKESHKKKKKKERKKEKRKWDSYFGGVGLLLFGWDSYFLQKGSPGLLLLKS